MEQYGSKDKTPSSTNGNGRTLPLTLTLIQPPAFQSQQTQPRNGQGFGSHPLITYTGCIFNNYGNQSGLPLFNLQGQQPPQQTVSGWSPTGTFPSGSIRQNLHGQLGPVSGTLGQTLFNAPTPQIHNSPPRPQQRSVRTGTNGNMEILVEDTVDSSTQTSPTQVLPNPIQPNVSGNRRLSPP